MKKFAAFLLLLALFVGAVPSLASAESAVTRIKDISKVQGMRSNQLMGYGLVVGLAGTGDGSSSAETIQSIANMLLSYGINVNRNNIKPDNTAAVMVTATLPPFAREGDTIDVTVSSIADADSLRGAPNTPACREWRSLCCCARICFDGWFYGGTWRYECSGSFSDGRYRCQCRYC